MLPAAVNAGCAGVNVAKGNVVHAQIIWKKNKQKKQGKHSDQNSKWLY